jgi:hypothetical protein
MPEAPWATHLSITPEAMSQAVKGAGDRGSRLTAA